MYKKTLADLTTLIGGFDYGVATISRLLKMIGLFCRILSLLWVSFAYHFKEPTNRSHQTYHFKEPTNRSHPI